MVAWVVRRVETEVSHPCPSWARCVRTSRTVPGLAGACLDLRFLEHPPPRISIHHRYILWSAKAGSNSTAPLHYIVKPRVCDSPASTDTFALRDADFSYSILLKVDGTPVA